MVALLSDRHRSSRREVLQLLQDLWQVRLSLGAVVRQKQAAELAALPDDDDGAQDDGGLDNDEAGDDGEQDGEESDE